LTAIICLFAVIGSGGVWKRPLSELIVGVPATSLETPIAFELLQVCASGGKLFAANTES